MTIITYYYFLYFQKHYYYSNNDTIIITSCYTSYHYVLLQIYYYVLLYHYYIIITGLLRHYCVITNGKSCNNDSIVTCYAKSKPPLLHYYYELLRHYYTGFYYYNLFQSPQLADDSLGLRRVTVTLARLWPRNCCILGQNWHLSCTCTEPCTVTVTQGHSYHRQPLFQLLRLCSLSAATRTAKWHFSNLWHSCRQIAPQQNRCLEILDATGASSHHLPQATSHRSFFS